MGVESCLIRSMKPALPQRPDLQSIVSIDVFRIASPTAICGTSRIGKSALTSISQGRRRCCHCPPAPRSRNRACRNDPCIEIDKHCQFHLVSREDTPNTRTVFGVHPIVGRDLQEIGWQ
jgi:hypothetical protein